MKENIIQLAPGKVFFEYGPISMILTAWKNDIPLTDLCIKGCSVAVEQLQEIGQQLTYIKKSWPLCEIGQLKGITRIMFEAVKCTGDEELTPLASVAGAIADTTADWLRRHGATKVIINNGGDIAVYLGEGEEVKVGVLPQISVGRLSETICLKQEDRVGGIATSGIGGRSFTRGIAECITVLAENCAIADACATSLANASFVHSPHVIQVPARTIDPNTDIPDMMVTIEVGSLSQEEIDLSLQKVEKKAKDLFEKKCILGMLAHIQGKGLIQLWE